MYYTPSTFLQQFVILVLIFTVSAPRLIESMSRDVRHNICPCLETLLLYHVAGPKIGKSSNRGPGLSL